MRVLVFDNYDSFTYNLVHILEEIAPQLDISVAKNDQISIEEIAQFDKILLSPGPGLPEESGILMELLETYFTTKDIFGVCLGMQAIAQSQGGTLTNLAQPLHGISSPLKMVKDTALFKDVPDGIRIAHYHSWVVDPATLPPSLEVTALDKWGNIMALKHVSDKVCGVQFHPESILTEQGRTILSNWLQD